MLALNRSLLKRKQTRRKVLEGLCGDRFYVQSPCGFSIENYNEVFHMIHKRDVLSFQCKMSLNRSMAMREIDGLSHIH
jgi:hypothetical protein